MNLTFNLATRLNQVRFLAETLAKWLLPFLWAWLIYLLISQGVALRHRKSLMVKLAGVQAKVRADNPPVSRAISSEAIKRQEKDIVFIDALVAKDRFSWTELLGRLEQAMTAGITLTGIEPDYSDRSLQITGLAENVDALRAYLDSLLNSDSLNAAYLLRQDNKKIKDRFEREHPVVGFRVEIQKAF